MLFHGNRYIILSELNKIRKTRQCNFPVQQTVNKRQPKILVLQTESVLIKFQHSSPLPIPLETTRVGDCVCIILYSQIRGIAYLSDIYLRELCEINFENYTKSINVIISENQHPRAHEELGQTDIRIFPTQKA